MSELTEDPKDTVNRIYPGFFPEPTPVVLPVYVATFTVRRDSADPIVTVTIKGSARIIDLIMHSASDAFREDVEP